ncbi:MAG TPA: protein kinase [Pseudonocardiaceae bacterium]|nr:protein kinase [Pseudonocardiaceae bacterium]
MLLTHDGFVYLADFGVARSLAGGTTLTATGATVGTLAYMAPERLLGQPGDRQTDIYALACVLHEALTGRSPFDGKNPQALMYAHVHLASPPASQRRPGIPRELDEVIACGMAKDPIERYTTASQLARAAAAALRPADQPANDTTAARARSSSGVARPPSPAPASPLLQTDALHRASPPSSAGRRKGQLLGRNTGL